MNYFLLWIECLIVGLLASALLAALVGRVGWRWLRAAFACLGLAAVIGPCAWGVGIVFDNERQFRWELGWFAPALALAVAVTVGSAVIWRKGMRRQCDVRPRAAHWSWLRLALGLQAAVVVCPITLYALHVAVLKRMDALDDEARQLVQALGMEPVPESLDAAPLYQQAWQHLPHKEKEFGIPKLKEPWTPTVQAAIDSPRWSRALDLGTPELDEALEQYREQITLLRAAAAQPLCTFERDYVGPAGKNAIPELDNWSPSNEFLLLHGQHALASEDVPEVIADINALWGLGRHMSEGPGYVYSIAGSSYETRAYKLLASLLMRVPLAEEELATICVPDGLSQRAIFARHIEREHPAQLVFYCGAPRVLYSWQVFETFFSLGDWKSELYLNFVMDADLAAYRRTWAQIRVDPRAPYRQAKEHLASLPPTVDKYDIASNFFAILEGLLVSTTQADAHRQLAQAAIAMHGFRAKHGRFPPSLDQLADEYPSLSLEDPFADEPPSNPNPFDERIRLKFTDTGWQLYSLGPNMTDEGGIAPAGDSEPADIVFEYIGP